MRRWSAASRSSRKRTEIFAGERSDELGLAQTKKPAKCLNGPNARMVSKNPPQLLKMTSSAAFRCAQAWLMEKPAAWVGRDARCLATALTAQRPSNKRPREDALLKAERSRRAAASSSSRSSCAPRTWMPETLRESSKTPSATRSAKPQQHVNPTC